MICLKAAGCQYFSIPWPSNRRLAYIRPGFIVSFEATLLFKAVNTVINCDNVVVIRNFDRIKGAGVGYHLTYPVNEILRVIHVDFEHQVGEELPSCRMLYLMDFFALQNLVSICFQGFVKGAQ